MTTHALHKSIPFPTNFWGWSEIGKKLFKFSESHIKAVSEQLLTYAFFYITHMIFILQITSSFQTSL